MPLVNSLTSKANYVAEGEGGGVPLVAILHVGVHNVNCFSPVLNIHQLVHYLYT